MNTWVRDRMANHRALHAAATGEKVVTASMAGTFQNIHSMFYSPYGPTALEMASHIPRNLRGMRRMNDWVHEHSLARKAAPAVTTPAVAAPGEKVVTASAHAFLEKRAALQSTEKTAAPVKTAFSGQTLRDALGTVASSLISPKGLLIGGSLIGLSELGGPTVKAWGEKLRQKLDPRTLPERATMDVDLANSFAKSVGKELGTRTVGLLGDFLSKSVAAPSEMFQNRERASVFEALKNEDEVISQADPQQLAEAYHTMVRFAPTLATDKNAVKTFLRESVLYGTGPNFMSIKQLADAERAVNEPVA